MGSAKGTTPLALVAMPLMGVESSWLAERRGPTVRSPAPPVAATATSTGGKWRPRQRVSVPHLLQMASREYALRNFLKFVYLSMCWGVRRGSCHELID